MRRLVLFAVLLLFGVGSMAQNTAKLTEEMQRQLNERTASDEQFRIIIGMAEKYDQAKLSKQVETMKAEQRREFVINELSRFSSASQADLLKTLNEGAKANIVKNLNSFWIFNGVSCVTNREMIYALSERPDIAYIESDELRNMLPEASLEMKKQNFKVENPQTIQTNRDGATSIAWNVTQVHADQVWSQYNINGSGVVIAVIDTGVDYYHPDIANHMWDGGTEYPNHGYDFVSSDNDPIDDNGHGSHCAGTVAGYGTSGIQTGMAPGATIMALKVLSAEGSGSSTNITSAMTFAIEHGADAVSMSLGGHGSINDPSSLNTSERDAMVTMLNAGVVALVAAGNEGEYYNSHHTQPSSLTGGASTTYYTVPYNIGNAGNCPAPWRNPAQTLDGGHTAVITIGASNRNDRKATFSSFGPCSWFSSTPTINGNTYNDYQYTAGDATLIGLIKPDIIVPGTDITSLYYKYNNSTYSEDDDYNQEYMAECGTSMATPGAAGITALVIQAWKAKHNGTNPTPAQIDEILETTALPVDFRDTKNNTTGAGRADAKAAVDAIYTTATKPGMFAVSSVNGGCVNLSWGASSSAAGGYAIYRDNEQVGTTTELTYTDKNPGTGKHTYYVRAIDDAGIQSVRSNADFCTVEPYAYADNANITWNDATQTATLGWVPTLSNTAPTGDLKYIDVDNTYSAFTGQNFSTAYWGMCFNPEDLRSYQGMSITSVTLAAYKTSLTGIVDDHLTLNIYRGTKYGNSTETPVYSQDITLENPNGWTVKTVSLTTPYALTDISEDLWITFSDFISSGYLGIAQEYPVAVGPYDSHSSNVLYMGSSHNHLTSEAVKDLCWSHVPDFGDDYNYALSFECHLERTTTYTGSYVVDYKGTDIADFGSLTTSYDHSPASAGGLASGANTYGITAKVSTGGNVVNTSCPQELTVVNVDNNQTASNITIDQTKVYLVQSNGKLTANNLTCEDVNRLIIEDGGQLVTNSAVSGTVKKEIKSTGSEGGGWNFIASPLVGSAPFESVSNLTSTGYHLFRYDEPSHYWVVPGSTSYAGFSSLANGQGYLYDNTANTNILGFAGALQPSGTEVTLSDLSYTTTEGHRLSGWHLVGNPFPCKATIGQSYYTINGKALTSVEAGTAINPGQGVMVKVGADDDENDVTFTRVSEASLSQPHQIDMTVAQTVVDRDGSEATVEDNAIVSFNEGAELEKFVFSTDNAKLYIPQNNTDYAIAVSETQGEMPVNFKAAENGSYTINVMTENVELSYLHLIDNMTGADVDLLATPDYTFNASVTDYESRFRLVFICGDANDDNGGDDNFAFFANGQLIVNNNGEATLQVVDMLGRIVSSQRISGSCSTQVNAATGVYMLRLINGNDVKVQKMVVR